MVSREDNISKIRQLLSDNSKDSIIKVGELLKEVIDDMENDIVYLLEILKKK